MAKDNKITQALSRALVEGVDSSTISRAYAWYLQIGGQNGYYEFRKQAREDIERLFESLDGNKERAITDDWIVNKWTREDDE